VNGREGTLARARKHLRRVLGELESVQLQLVGIQISLSHPVGEGMSLEESDETDPLTELEATIACVLNDSIQPALEDLRGVLASMVSTAEES